MAEAGHPRSGVSRRVTVAEAAWMLDTTVDALRKRVQRGTIAHGRDEYGRVWILMDPDRTRHDTGRDTTGRRSAAIMANESEEKRQRFLRAAYEVAMPKGGPSTSVHVHEVAKAMGLKVRDEDVQAELTSMIEDLQEQGDAEGWSSTDGRFRLTSQGAEKVKGS